MKRDLLWFSGLILTLVAGLYCFHVHEERHRFVVLGNAFGPTDPGVVIMFDRKTHKSCLVAVGNDSVKDSCPR
jgi:hypothetical protein